MSEGTDSACFKRILLKMSGEALMGAGHTVIEPKMLDRLVTEIREVYDLGVQIAIVVGGGNFFRGAQLSQVGIGRVTGDYMGMLATVMNALALRDALERSEISCRVLSAIPMGGIVDHFDCRKAIHHLKQGRIVIFAAGTGNPFVTTDSAASLRAIEIDADVVLKATNVDGVFTADPGKNPDAELYDRLTFQEALSNELAVMDLAAFCQARDYNMPLRVFNIHKPGAMLRVIQGKAEGTAVERE